jgi:hypothetical protein
MATTDLANEIEALERNGWKALSGPDGVGYNEHVMADDGLMVFPSGPMTKTEALGAIAGAPPWQAFELSDVQVVDLASDAALIAYRAIANRSGHAPYEAWMTSVYVHRGDTWLLLLHQQSPGT